MSKVFRLYKEGTTTYQGWNESPAFPYNSNARDTIEDPDGASAKNEITSIPSPFARIDLVKTAFKEVNKRASSNLADLNGDTIFHKMVSDALDVGEIFFNIDRFNEQIEIITWDPSQMIPILMEDGNINHYFVADAMQKYLISDANTYNFGLLKNIYLLNYKTGPDELNIIGATSPATLFFSGANKLDYVNDIFFANNDKPFDGDFQPLYRRDFDYIKMWWTLRKTINNFSRLFPEIDTYLNLTFRAIKDQQVKAKLTEITTASVSDFSKIDVKSTNQSNQVEVLDYPLFKKKAGEVSTDNEFTIEAERVINNTKPLVLPVESGNKYSGLQYVNGTWGNENKAPYKSSVSDINKRKLPFDGSTYPYLTVSDFLEDSIVKVPHSINKKYYFDGNMAQCEEKTSFLMPIKPLYFKFFSIETLRSQMPDGKLAFEMETVAGGSVLVTIRIPIKGNASIQYIEFQRIYYAQRRADVSETQNSGGMITFDFTGFVMPSVKFQNADDAYYTISCVSTFSSQYTFNFYENGQLIRNIPTDCRNRERGMYGYKAETYTLEKSNFDFIQIAKDNICNLIIPTFLKHQNLDDYEFTVDLGTSNTHIEFKKAGASGSESFNTTDSESIISTFFVQSFVDVEGSLLAIDLREENDLIAADFVPFSIGGVSDFQFPTRTVLSYAKTTDWTEKLRIFGLLNFNLTYNKRASLQYNAKPMVNIKWSNQANAQTAMQAYISNIMLLIRNKVIANNGNIAKTNITWFYPNSMSPRRLAQLKEAWNISYTKFFNEQGTTRNLSESVAPIQYYFRRYATATNLVNVDIGGGTTDIAFSSNGKVDYITSFKFAANSLFEDSFSNINPNNGIVDWFKNDILRLLQSKSECNDLVSIFNSNLDQPSNMASFLFSLKDNSATKSLERNNIDFNRVLQNDTKFKIVFILFYTAIIYHIAKIIKAKNLKLPRHIAFSGNGSKIIGIISTDSKIMAKFTKVIFEKVLETKYDTALDILGLEQGSNPKESTCKGGLQAMDSNEDEIESIILKDSFGNLVTNGDTYSTIDNNQKKQIENSIKSFFNFALYELPLEFNFDNNFGVDDVTIKIAQEECCNDLDTYLEKGIELSTNESGNVDNKIEDALSFYPIKGVIQTLSEKIKEYYEQKG